MNTTVPDPIADALRCGHKEEALRLIAERGVWTPFRDPEYFDTETCFPVFSSTELIPPFLRKLGVSDEDKTIKGHQVGPDFFSFASYLEGILTLNPGTDSEWKLGSEEFAAIVSHTKKG